MRAAAVIAIIIVAACLILWATVEYPLEHIANVFPLLGGHPPSFHDLGGLAMVLITIWGLRRIFSLSCDRDRNDQDEFEYDDPYEDQEDDPDEDNEE